MSGCNPQAVPCFLFLLMVAFSEHSFIFRSLTLKEHFECSFIVYFLFHWEISGNPNVPRIFLLELYSSSFHIQASNAYDVDFGVWPGLRFIFFCIEIQLFHDTYRNDFLLSIELHFYLLKIDWPHIVSLLEPMLFGVNFLLVSTMLCWLL